MTRIIRKMLRDLFAGTELNHLQTENRRYRSMYYAVEQVNDQQHKLLHQANKAMGAAAATKPPDALPSIFFDTFVEINSYCRKN